MITFADILSVYTYTVDTLSGGNDVARGLITASIIGSVTFAARSFPRKLLNLVIHHTTTSLTLPRIIGDHGPIWRTRRFYDALLEHIAELPSARFDRNRAVRDVNGADPKRSLALGMGRHWFITEGRLFCATITQLPSQGIGDQKEEVRLTTYGFSMRPIQKLIYPIYEKSQDDDTAYVYSVSPAGGHWQSRGEVADLPAGVVVPQAIEGDLWGTIDAFSSGRDWYRSRGLAYKLTILLEGQPGTGKTSIIREIARRTGRSLHLLNLSMDGLFIKDLLHNAKGGIVAIEDFDDTDTVGHRAQPAIAAGGLPTAVAPTQQRRDVPLSVLLEALDGAIPLNDLIVVMTTNHPEKIDPALLRPGRVDRRFCVDAMTDPDIRRYVAQMYDGASVPAELSLLPQRGCELHARFLEHRHDPAAFIAALPTAHDQARLAAE